MKRINENKRVKRSLFSFENFMVFFMSAAVMHTFNIIMFVKLSDIKITYGDAKLAAASTAANIIFLTLIFSVFDNIRKKSQIKKPVQKILEAAKQITEGDFSVRIKTTHKKKKNEFDVIIDYFNKMTQELSGVETLRKDFISNVSHEIKTPISIIQNYATMLQDPELDEESRIEYAKTITLASQRLSSLVTNILKLNKLENQQIFPDAKEYNLCEQLRECLLSYEELWEKYKINIESNIDEELIINADEELLSFVWINLFSNAIKFTPENGFIKVKTIQDDKSVSVIISDTGCGMPEDMIPHIFDKFYQGDTAHSTQGNGLGLTLVKRVLDIVGGDITVQSKIDEGSTFTVRLNKTDS